MYEPFCYEMLVGKEYYAPLSLVSLDAKLPQQISIPDLNRIYTDVLQGVRSLSFQKYDIKKSGRE